MGEIKNIKAEAVRLIQSLPEDCTFEDIQYHLYVLQKVERGIRSLEEEGGIPHEEVRERLAKWLTR
jgi:hypothetical protein